MKGIILAGGSGTRLYPNTVSVSKQLMPVYDKPMIYYPLSVLMLAGLRDILIITTPQHQSLFYQLLGNGNQWGMNFSYCIQNEPSGIAHAFVLAENFIKNDSVCLILGDNIFYTESLTQVLSPAIELTDGAYLFAAHVQEPQHYGVAVLKDNKVIDLVEKPNSFISPWAITGIYFYDAQVTEFAKSLKPSARNELEITDLSKMYLQENQLNLAYWPRGSAWLDTGTFDRMLEAAQFVQVLEKRQGLKIACPEEIAWRKKFINDEELIKLAAPLEKSGYGQYLLNLLNQDKSYGSS